MPRIKTITLEEQAKTIHAQHFANLQHREPVKKFSTKHYMILYAIALDYTSSPAELTTVLRNLPEASNCAHSVLLARKNRDRVQSKKMLTRIREIAKECVSTLKLPSPL